MIESGEPVINISTDGLEPELEAFMLEIMERVQTRQIPTATFKQTQERYIPIRELINMTKNIILYFIGGHRMRTFYSSSEVTKHFNITYRKLSYLFEARKLRSEDFEEIAGVRIFKKSDFGKVKKALSSIRFKKS